MVPMTTNALLEIPMYLMPARWGLQAWSRKSAWRS